MTRIIGGSAGGRRLQTPPGDATRPTADRVREALFSALEAQFGSLHGLRLLDLYAGSGAVGLEAASRGAVRVTAVESDRRTARLVAANAAALGFDVDVGGRGGPPAPARPPRPPGARWFPSPRRTRCPRRTSPGCSGCWWLTTGSSPAV